MGTSHNTRFALHRRWWLGFRSLPIATVQFLAGETTFRSYPPENVANLIVKCHKKAELVGGFRRASVRGEERNGFVK
jgi:hypothetical protein